MKALTHSKIILTILILGLAILPVILCDSPCPAQTREYLFGNPKGGKAATNTVSAIYLGYRAMCTPGETLALIVSISGRISILINFGRHK